MKKLLGLICLITFAHTLAGQSLEIKVDEVERGLIGETIKAPLHLRNISDKALAITLRRIRSQIGSTQINYYCLDNCTTGQHTGDLTIKLEPGESTDLVKIALETGLETGLSTIRYSAIVKNTGEIIEFDVNFAVEEKKRNEIYSSATIVLYDLYPNPIADEGYIEYKMFSDSKKAKILIHNILGNNFDEVSLPFLESKVKLQTAELSAGIYFYTLYLDNVAVATRKLVVKK
jgi:hypothetical protein